MNTGEGAGGLSLHDDGEQGPLDNTGLDDQETQPDGDDDPEDPSVSCPSMP